MVAIDPDVLKDWAESEGIKVLYLSPTYISNICAACEVELVIKLQNRCASDKRFL